MKNSAQMCYLGQVYFHSRKKGGGVELPPSLFTCFLLFLLRSNYRFEVGSQEVGISRDYFWSWKKKYVREALSSSVYCPALCAHMRLPEALLL